MLQLAQAGVIPITTPEQRSRNLGTGGATYGVPKYLADANSYGYIGPNLEEPDGFRWKSKAGVFTLVPRGG